MKKVFLLIPIFVTMITPNYTNNNDMVVLLKIIVMIKIMMIMMITAITITMMITITFFFPKLLPHKKSQRGRLTPEPACFHTKQTFKKYISITHYTYPTRRILEGDTSQPPYNIHQLHNVSRLLNKHLTKTYANSVSRFLEVRFSLSLISLCISSLVNAVRVSG